MNDHIKNLNNTSLYKNDLLQANRDFATVGEFDPTTLTEITGGINAIVSPTGCGKSWLLRDILSKIHNNYDAIYLFCPTAKLQDCYDYFPKENIYDFFNEQLLEDIYMEQKADMEDKKKNTKPKKPLIILDDIIDSDAYWKSKMLDKLSTQGRPLYITVILLSQYFSKIKQLHRVNLRSFIGFDIDNSDELEKFTRSFMCSTNKRCGKMLYKLITGEKKYQCCVVLIHKNYEEISGKVKKYMADPNVKKFKIKPTGRQINIGEIKKLDPAMLPECNDVEFFYNL
jgi:hypothetical protein